MTSAVRCLMRRLWKKGPNMIIKQVYLEIGVIYVSSDDNFGPKLERYINVINEFDAAVARGMKKTNRIM